MGVKEKEEQDWKERRKTLYLLTEKDLVQIQICKLKIEKVEFDFETCSLDKSHKKKEMLKLILIYFPNAKIDYFRSCHILRNVPMKILGDNSNLEESIFMNTNQIYRMNFNTFAKQILGTSNFHCQKCQLL